MSTLTSNDWWKNHFLTATNRQGIDYVSKDGTIVVEVKDSNQGLAAFQAGIMQLAKVLSTDTTIQRACLLFNTTKLSAERIKQEWHLAKQLFTPPIARRLGLIAIVDGPIWIDPDDAMLRRMASAYEDTLPKDKPFRWLIVLEGERFIEITKVLLIRWLRQEGPIAQGQLAEMVGCSYPTVRESLIRLEKKNYLVRQKGRKVELSQFPYEVWQEMLALSPRTRQTISLVDASKSIIDPQQLYNRLKLLRPADIAIGGVIAARRWQPRFNLNGTPRIDISVHVPDWYFDLPFLQKLDPALQQTDESDAQPILVIHPLQRAVSLFTEKAHDLPIADPVETALDLVEMGLTQQANDLFHHLRKEVRLA